MGSGGWRIGAGRPGWKVKAEACMRLEIKRWHREGVLFVGRSGTWSWTNSDGERVGSIGYRASADSVFLDYSVSGQPAGQWVRLERTACNFGGARTWFCCPVCERRAGVLYMRSGRFACRHCQRVAYQSQSADVCGRSWLRQAKVEAKLGDHWRRPKGMHRSTYERLKAKLIDCELQREDAIEAFISRLAPDVLSFLR